MANICRDDSNREVVSLKTNLNLISYIRIAFQKMYHDVNLNRGIKTH